MPQSAVYPRNGDPLSLGELRKLMGDGVLQRFLRYSAVRDTRWHYDDFAGDTINLDNYAVANGGGAAAASFATVVLENGAIRGTTGTAGDATASASLIMPLNWYGDRNCGMEVRFKLDVVTSVLFEVGFIDAVPGSNGSGVNDIDTPTFNAADSALLHLHTGQTLATMAFATNGSTAGQPDLATTLVQTTLPTAATWHRVRIQLEGNNAYCWLDGRLEASHDTDADGHVEGGVALAPWLYVRALNGTGKLMDIDYLSIWGDRN